MFYGECLASNLHLLLRFSETCTCGRQRCDFTFQIQLMLRMTMVQDEPLKFCIVILCNTSSWRRLERRLGPVRRGTYVIALHKSRS